MSRGPLVSYRAGTWLIDECPIAFFMSCLLLRVWTYLFCHYLQCHLSYHQHFVWYPGYHGYQFCGPLPGGPDWVRKRKNLLTRKRVLWNEIKDKRFVKLVVLFLVASWPPEQRPSAMQCTRSYKISNLSSLKKVKLV